MEAIVIVILLYVLLKLIHVIDTTQPHNCRCLKFLHNGTPYYTSDASFIAAASTCNTLHIKYGEYNLVFTILVFLLLTSR